MRKKDFSFAQVPTIKARRSYFDLSQGVKGSASVGTLYPFYCQEVYPGDSFKVNCSTVTRVSSAFLKPVMDNLFLDQYFFFVPSRLVFDRWGEVFGENKLSAWAQPSPVEVPGPALSGDVNGPFVNVPAKDSVAGYIGWPVGQEISTSVMSKMQLLPFRSFAKIYDDWFRDENNIDPMNIITGSTGQGEYLNNNPWGPSNYFGKCPKIAKFHDYFTSCLPAPQKGEPVEIGSAVIPERVLPVSTYPGQFGNTASASTMSSQLFPTDIASLAADAGYLRVANNGSRRLFFSSSQSNFTPASGAAHFVDAASTSQGSLAGSSDTSLTGTSAIYPANLMAYDPGAALGSVSVNDLRLAFQTQRMLERDARGGNRYTEYIQAHFGVHSPDSRLQRSEFLGGKRVPVSIYQVSQTVPQSAEGQPALGSLGAFSYSSGKSRFTKGFVEHGYVIGVMAFRYHHTYAQGIERFWTRKNRLDFYDPVFANIGEQPVYKYQLFAGVENADEVFGYNEPWADLRFRPSRVCGEMSPNLAQSLDVYHFADEYANAPVLGQQFIEENPDFVNRTIAVQDNVSDQFIFDIYVKNDAIRELPVYSVPGLIDHR